MKKRVNTMRKGMLTTMLLAVLVLSLSVGVVIANKPDQPPGKPVEEKDTFIVSIHSGDAILLKTLPPQSGGSTFEVITLVEDWDYIGGVEGGDPRERYDWSYWDGAYGEPMVTYGLFTIADKFYDADGNDLRPDETNINGVTGRPAHMLAVGHGINVDDQMDWWYTVLEWEVMLQYGEHAGKLVSVSFGGRSLIDSDPEGIPTPDDGSPVESWTTTLYTDRDPVEPDTNTEFKLHYWWYETELLPRGNSGKYTEEEVYQQVVIWDFDGAPQPDISVSITTTVTRPP